MIKKYVKSNTELTTFWRKPLTECSPELDIVVCDNCIMGALRKAVEDFAYCPYCGAKVVRPGCSKTETDADEAMRDAEAASKYLDDNEDTIAGRWHS